MSSPEPKSLGVAPVKHSKFAKKGDKVALIGTVKDIIQQNGTPVLHLTIDDSKGMPIIIESTIAELIGSPRPA